LIQGLDSFNHSANLFVGNGHPWMNIAQMHCDVLLYFFLALRRYECPAAWTGQHFSHGRAIADIPKYVFLATTLSRIQLVNAATAVFEL